MAYQNMVCVDPDEGMGSTHETVSFCNADRLDRTIRDMSKRWPNSTLHIYTLSELQKIKEPPKYARYKLNEHGEILPV